MIKIELYRHRLTDGSEVSDVVILTADAAITLPALGEPWGERLAEDLQRTISDNTTLDVMVSYTCEES